MMTEQLPESMLRELSAFLARKMGLHFPERRWRELEKGLLAAAPELGCGSARECFERLVAEDLSKRQIEILAGRLTIGETYFFRDHLLFAALEEQVLPELIRRRAGERRLRLWSAGCATGEEPYSLAILLRRLLPDLPRWNFTLLATDINPRFLERAREGIYGEWSFRDCPAWIRERFFLPLPGGRRRIQEEIRELVTYAYLNLAADAYPSLANSTTGMDLILCRNVIMYFSESSRRRTVAGLHRSLTAGGYLAVSPSELSLIEAAGYSLVQHRGAILYRKERETSGLPDRGPDARPAGQARASAPAGAEGPSGPRPAPAPAPAPGPAVRPPAESPSRGAALREAKAHYAKGRYAAAAGTLEALLDGRQTGEPEALALLARCYANLGEVEKGLAWMRRAVAADKLNPVFHYLAGMLAEENHQPEEAAADLRRAIYLDPRFVLAHFNLGKLALRHDRPGQADKHFANALAGLASCRPEEIVPESEGLTAGRLEEVIRIIAKKENES